MGNEVESLLRDKGIVFTVSGNDYVTTCMNPEHEDSNPSFRIDRIKGIGHCFSCNYSINIFKHFGIIANMTNIKVAGLKEKLNDIRTNTYGLDMLDGYTPRIEAYRGITSSTLKYFEAFTTEKVKGMEDRIIFPLRDIKGRIKAFIGRHALTNYGTRYMNYPSGVTLPLFPVKLPTNSKSMLLVEGIFDMMNLYDKGLTNVVATMGTNTLNNDSAKGRLLPFRAQGVEKIFIVFDGDEAGIKAANELLPRIEELGFIVEIINIAEDTDPGDMSQTDVDRLKEITNYENKKTPQSSERATEDETERET